MQEVWESFGEGSLNVKVYDFLIDGPVPGQSATCEDLENWDTQHDLTNPGFVDIYDVYIQYNSLYGNSGIPLILMFIPNTENPSASTLVYNSSSGLGHNTGDKSDDLSSILNDHGYWSQSIDEIDNGKSKKLLKVVDLLGRESSIKPNIPLIYIYEDGSHERKIVFD